VLVSQPNWQFAGTQVAEDISIDASGSDFVSSILGSLKPSTWLHPAESVAAAITIRYGFVGMEHRDVSGGM
jgi:hypothetical protein